MKDEKEDGKTMEEKKREARAKLELLMMDADDTKLDPEETEFDAKELDAKLNSFVNKHKVCIQMCYLFAWLFEYEFCGFEI